MMMNNPGLMGQQGLPPNQGQPLPPAQQQATTSQMIPAGVNPALNIQGRQNPNDDALSRCLVQTQRLRESLQVLLNSTKQAANIESEEQSSSSSSSTTNLSTNPVNSTIRNNIDRKLYDMSTSLDQLVGSLEQYDYKLNQNQQSLINHYNELSYEKQGTLMDEWSSNTKWTDKLMELYPSMHPTTQLYRRSNHRNLNANIRSRIDGPSSTIIDRIINQFESTQQQQQQQQQQSLTKDYSISIQRLSDHLNIIEFSLFRSGLDIYLYLRHCTVEHVIVKPLNEKKQLGNNFNNKLFPNYRALDIIAGHIRAAAVFYAPFGTPADQVLTKILSYIYKYQMLNYNKCVNCQKHLLNGLQPTWRDFRTNECYHEECLN